MRRLRKAFVVPMLAGALVVAAVAPAGAQGSPPGGPSAAEWLAARSGPNPGAFDANRVDYDILLAVATDAGLAGALGRGPGALSNITLFAPIDAAFVNTARSLGYRGWDEAGAASFLLANTSREQRTQILLYHVSPGAKNSLQVLTAGSIATAQGQSFAVRGPFLRDNFATPDPVLNIFSLNNRTSNGIVHSIANHVLVPAGVL